MIKIDGQLAIRALNSKHGIYKLGTLHTSIGTFAVKEKELEQFSPGKYQGEFVISLIELSDYRSNGRITTEMRAYIDSMTISSTETLSQEDIEKIEVKEIDPAIEEVSQPKGNSMPKVVDIATATAPEQTKPSKIDEIRGADEILFGHLWPLGEIVKLDKTVERTKLRAQRDRLDVLGYDFDAITQEWKLNTSKEAL